MCAGQSGFFFRVFLHAHRRAAYCDGGVRARSLCSGIVKNVVLDSSCANE